MNSRDFRNLTEAYTNIYSQEEETFFFKEDIDLLSDSDIDEAVEEAIDELLDEGFTLEEIDQAFDDFDDSFIAEGGTGRLGRMVFPGDKDIGYDKKRENADKKSSDIAKQLKKKSTENANRSAREAASKAPKTSSTGSSNVVKSSGGDMNSQYVRGSSGSSSSNTKTSAKVTTSGTPVRAKVTTNDTEPKKPSQSSSSPAKKVSGSVKKAIAHKTTDADHADAVRRSRSASLEKALTSKPSPTIRSRVGSSIRKAASSAKKGLKGLIKKAADKVASGANKVSKRMSEEYDQYDLVLEFLQTEGFAKSLDGARVLMVNELDREDIETIVNAYN